MSEPPGPARPRLLVLASTYPRWPGDPEPGFVHELARRMTADFDVTVLCPHAPGAAARERLDGVDVVRWRYAPARFETLVNDGGIVGNLKRSRWKALLIPGFVFAMAWHSWRLVRRARPDVIHAHWLLPQGLVVALLRMLEPRTPPFVVTSHGADLFALRSAPLQALKRFTARRAAALTVVSEAMRGELARLGVDPAAVQVQPMGTDLRRRFTPDPDVARVPGRLLFVGRMVEKKGLSTLIDAMPAILGAHPAAVLEVAGFGPEFEARRAQATRRGVDAHVRFLGAVSQDALPAMYRRAAVFVAPFRRARDGDQEGLGLVSVEAGGCGCALVLGDVPAVRSAFAGLPGVQLVPPDDPVALAQACLAALVAPAPGAALADALATYDWNERALAYRRILGEVARRR